MSQKNSIKNYNLIIRKEKLEKVVLSQIYITIKILLFCKYHNNNEFVKRSPDSNRNDLKDFKDKLEIFFHDIIDIKLNNKDQIKDLEERKAVFDTALVLYNELLNKYKIKYDKFPKAYKKRIKTQNMPENVCIDLYEDDLLEGDEEVKLEPE